MVCQCPQCNAGIEVNVDEIPVSGKFRQCPECKKKYWACRESFSLRAYKKFGPIHCAACGEELSIKPVCRGCGALYPDYFLIQANRPAQKNKIVVKFSFPSAVKSSRKKVQVDVFDSDDNTPATKTAKIPTKILVRLGGGVLLLALLALGIGNVYLGYKQTGQYVDKYIFALYGIASGMDLSRKICGDAVSEWKERTVSGRVYDFRLTLDQENKLRAVKGQIEAAMRDLPPPPQNFVDSHAGINELFSVYLSLYALNTQKNDSLDAFIAALGKAEESFQKKAMQTKSSFPEELSSTLIKASTRFKNLAFIL